MVTQSAHWKKHDIGLGSAFYLLCDLEQVISLAEGALSSPVTQHLCSQMVYELV